MIPSESGKISAIMIASISVGMSFSVNPCESVIGSLITDLFECRVRLNIRLRA